MSPVAFTVQPRKYYLFLPLAVLRKLQWHSTHLHLTWIFMQPPIICILIILFHRKSSTKGKILFFKSMRSHIDSFREEGLYLFPKFKYNFKSTAHTLAALDYTIFTIIYQYNVINDSCKPTTAILQIIKYYLSKKNVQSTQSKKPLKIKEWAQKILCWQKVIFLSTGKEVENL